MAELKWVALSSLYRALRDLPTYEEYAEWCAEEGKRVPTLEEYKAGLDAAPSVIGKWFGFKFTQ